MLLTRKTVSAVRSEEELLDGKSLFLAVEALGS